MEQYIFFVTLMIREYCNCFLFCYSFFDKIKGKRLWLLISLYLGLSAFELWRYIDNGFVIPERELYALGLLHLLLVNLIIPLEMHKLFFFTMLVSFLTMAGQSLALTVAEQVKFAIHPKNVYSIVSTIWTIIYIFPCYEFLDRFSKIVWNEKVTKITKLVDCILALYFFGIVAIRDFSSGHTWNLCLSRLLVTATVLLFIHLVLLLFERTYSNDILNQKLTALEILRENEKQHFERLKNNWLSTKKSREELHKIAVYLNQCLAKEDYSSIKAIVEEYQNYTENQNRLNLCGHRVIDALVGYWQNECQREKINFIADIRVANIQAEDMDLAILLGNALDNAYTASKKLGTSPKFVNLKLVTKNSLILLEIKNSFDGILVNKDGVYYSAKCEFLKPGTGISNMQLVADKYQGSFCTKTEDGCFILQVALRNQHFVEE